MTIPRDEGTTCHSRDRGVSYYFLRALLRMDGSLEPHLDRSENLVSPRHCYPMDQGGDMDVFIGD